MEMTFLWLRTGKQMVEMETIGYTSRMPVQKHLAETDQTIFLEVKETISTN